MTPAVSGQVALVTGAARGLGLAMGRRLLADGWAVALSDRDTADPDGAVADLRARHGSDRVLLIKGDVTSDDSVTDLVDSVARWAGRLDVVIANAGTLHRGPSQELSSEQLQHVLDVNVVGALRCIRAAFPLLCESPDPSVLVVGSIGSSLGMPLRAAYNVSKTALLGLTRTLAAEWGPFGIRVNAVAPGFIETAMMRSGIDSGALDEAAMLRRIPLRRLGAPSDVADVAAFLCSADAAYVTGAVLPVDGGIVIDGTFV